uniref:ORF80 n=1 Tax=Malaco herpesvirus 1 TaxID=3031797 RepID=A0AA48SFH0_9VIRU|nr:TPA_asm: ORF80 [Malaco herpesvirus 1]
MAAQETFIDLEERNLLEDVYEFLIEDMDIDMDNKRYKQIEIDPENHPGEFIVFNPTLYHTKVDELYRLMDKIIEDGRYTIREGGVLEDRYRQVTDPNLLAFIQESYNNTNMTLYQLHKEDILRLLATYKDFGPIFGVIDVLVNRTSSPYRIHTMGGTNKGLYNNIISSFYNYQQDSSVDEKLAILKMVADDLASLDKSTIFDKIIHDPTNHYIIEVPSLNHVLISDKNKLRFYTIRNKPRPSKPGDEEVIGTMLSKFLNGDNLPISETFQQLTTPEIRLLLMRETIRVFHIMANTYGLTSNQRNTFRKNFINLGILISTANPNKNYLKIIDTMDVENDKLVFRNDRIEYEDYSMNISLPGNRQGVLTSFFKDDKIYRDIQLPGCENKSSIPFYKNPQLVLINSNWSFSSEVMQFFLRDASHVDSPDSVNTMEEMIYKMMMKSQIATSKFWFTRLIKNIKTGDADYFKQGFFFDPTTDNEYTLEGCLSKLQSFSRSFFVKANDAKQYGSKWFRIKNKKIEGFIPDMELVQDEAVRIMLNEANKYFSILTTENKIPISLLETVDGELYNFCNWIRTAFSENLIPLDTIRQAYQNNRVVKHDVFKEVFVPKNSSYEIGEKYLPEFVEDMNKCFSPESKDVFMIKTENIIFFRGVFYNLTEDDILPENEYNYFVKTLRDNQLDPDIFEAIISSADFIIPPIFHHTEENITRPLYMVFFKEMLQVYGYDMMNSPKERVIFINAENAPDTYIWLRKLFHDQPNKLSNNKTRTMTIPIIPGVTTDLPKFKTDEDIEHTTVTHENHKFYCDQQGKPTIYVGDVSGNDGVRWLGEFMELLNYFTFTMKLLPVQRHQTGDYYTLVVTSNQVLDFFGSYNEFIDHSFNAVWKQIADLDYTIPAVTMPSNLLHQLSRADVGGGDWYNFMTVMPYMEDMSRKMRKQESVFPSVLVNSPIVEKTRSQGLSVQIVSEMDFKSL